MNIQIMAVLLVTLAAPAIQEKPSKKDIASCHKVRASDQAVRACSRIIRRFGTSPAVFRAKIYTRRGQAFALAKHYKKAEQNFSEAIKIKPDFVESYMHRGGVYSRTERHSKAIEDYSKVIKLKPDFAIPYYNRGTAFVRKEKYARAIADFSTVIGLKPSFWRAYVNRGAIYSKRKQFDKALLDYDNAYKLNKTEHSILINRAGLNLKFGRRKQAYQDYQVGLKLSSNHDHTQEIQQKLKKLGFYQGAVTGVFDEKTNNALQKWLLNDEETQ